MMRIDSRPLALVLALALTPAPALAAGAFATAFDAARANDAAYRAARSDPRFSVSEPVRGRSARADSRG